MEGSLLHSSGKRPNPHGATTTSAVWRELLQEWPTHDAYKSRCLLVLRICPLGPRKPQADALCHINIDIERRR